MNSEMIGENTSSAKGLIFIGVIFLVAGAALLYGYLTKPKFESKEDLVFITGDFDGYTVTNSGKTHLFSFHLKEYSNQFRINGDFFHLLNFNRFQKIKNGNAVTIGYLRSLQGNINNGHAIIYVYAINDTAENYLDWDQTRKQYNNNF